MKYKLLMLLSCLLEMTGIVSAQDFEPGQQAQGYLNSKNVMVDHATGTFHYKVPLYTFRSGNYQLPVSLDYVAKGVRWGDKPGLFGYNWTLNVGGVVTRVIRGGMADEDDACGYLWAEKRHDALPLEDDVERVNKRGRDGECDIFTAVFNGQSVNFIIRMDQNYEIYAEPLERTNVKIECEARYGSEIEGWIVTDEDGNRYIYRQKEWTSDINKEGAISFNGVRGKTYVSSWYLNRIEPLNAEPVIFNYREDVREYGKQDGISEVRYSSFYQSRYDYGRPMQERVFDFSKYKPYFDDEIERARSYLGDFALKQQLNNRLYVYTGYGDWVRNPNFDAEVQTIHRTFRVMGQLADFKHISEASNGLIQVLNDLIDSYSGVSSQSVQMAVSAFRNAKSYVLQSIDEINRNVTMKEVGNMTFYVVRSPLLESIGCVDREMVFQYEERWDGIVMMTNLRLRDILKHRISEVKIGSGTELFELSFWNKDSVETDRVKFNYYSRPTGVSFGQDIWGYYKQIEGEPGELYYPFVDAVCSKSMSLEKIALSDGGSIRVDYEPNRVINSLRPDFEDASYASDYGGIRVKSIFVHDPVDGVSDTILYTYPVPGLLVFDEYSNRERVSYGSFQDEVWHTRVKYSGSAFMNTGNNGVYYRYVEETTKGKGTKAYLFHLPHRHPMIVALDAPYAFWLNGLPLATALYDENGNLKQIVKNRYYTDLAFTDNYNGRYTHLYFNFNADYFVAGDRVIGYNRVLPQVKAYEYYMNEDEMSAYYQNQGSVFLYRDGLMSSSMNPYREIYLPNIQPRTNVVLPVQNYNLLYGGKTVLKEQLVYNYGGDVTDRASWRVFSEKTAGTPFEKVEYYYDNLSGSVKPTRVIKTDSHGNTNAIVTKRVTEMQDGAGAIFEKMKQYNVLNPVVKQLNLKDGRVLEETVSCYEMVETDNRCYFGLACQYLHVPESDIVYTPSAMDAILFTRGEENYRLEKSYDYEQNHYSYLPVGETSRSGQSAVCYDVSGNQCILKGENGSSKSVIALDMNKYQQRKESWDSIQHVARVFDVAERFYESYKMIRVEELDMIFQDYLNSKEHDMIMRLIKTLVDRGKGREWSEVQVLLDSVCSNNGRYMLDFSSIYKLIMDITRGFNITREEFHFLTLEMTRSIVMNNITFKSWSLVDRRYLFSSLEDDTLRITEIPASGRLKLFVLTKGNGGVNYDIEYSNGIESKSVSFLSTPEYRVEAFDIDLSGYTGVTSVTMNRPKQNVAYVALVPEGMTFEATSYNLDGTIFCKFNQNGQIELNEYDGSGRLIRVKNERGDVVKMFKYNKIIN